MLKWGDREGSVEPGTVPSVNSYHWKRVYGFAPKLSSWANNKTPALYKQHNFLCGELAMTSKKLKQYVNVWKRKQSTDMIERKMRFATVKFNVWEIKDGESIYQVWEAKVVWQKCLQNIQRGLDSNKPSNKY